MHGLIVLIITVIMAVFARSIADQVFVLFDTVVVVVVMVVVSNAIKVLQNCWRRRAQREKGVSAYCRIFSSFPRKFLFLGPQLLSSKYSMFCYIYNYTS